MTTRLTSDFIHCKETVFCTQTVLSSDQNLKDNINPIKNTKEIITKLNPVEYTFKDDTDSKLHSGFIAQELNNIHELNHLVNVNDRTNTLGLNYIELIPYLVSRIQEMQREIESLKKQLKNKQ